MGKVFSLREMAANETAGQGALKGRGLLTVADLSSEEVLLLVAMAGWWKERKGDVSHRPLVGKTLGMMFSKPSTRTRVSFQVAVNQLGGQAVALDAGDLQLGRGETVADTARVLSRYLDGILIRTFDQGEITEFAAHASIPLINGLTDQTHPTQALADLLTIHEHFGYWEGLKLAYVGDGNNVVHSLMMAAAKVGMDLVCACPAGYEPDPVRVAAARAVAAVTGSKIEIRSDPREAVSGAAVVYTDVWTSMGRERERAARLAALGPYQVNAEILGLAREDAIFLHCLPAHRGEEVSAEVLEGPCSLAFAQAENRLHVFKAILSLMI